MFKKYFGRKSNPTSQIEEVDELEHELKIDNTPPKVTAFKRSYVIGAVLLLTITFLGSFIYTTSQKNKTNKTSNNKIEVAQTGGHLNNIPKNYDDKNAKYGKGNNLNDDNSISKNSNQEYKQRNEYNQVPQQYNQIPQSKYISQNNNIKSEDEKQAEIINKIEAAKAKEKLDANKSPIKFSIEGGSNEKKDN